MLSAGHSIQESKDGDMIGHFNLDLYIFTVVSCIVRI